MTYRVKVDPYYDPFDFKIDDDPYPAWKQLRDVAPLYHNDRYGDKAKRAYPTSVRGWASLPAGVT
nr:hypothetical protein [Mycobacterium sp. 1164966.3]